MWSIEESRVHRRRRKEYKKKWSPNRGMQREHWMAHQKEGRRQVLWRKREQFPLRRPVKIEVASIPRLITAIWNKCRRIQLHAIQHLRQILYLVPCAAEVIISSDILPRFLEFLHLLHHPELQFEAVLCLKIISSKHPHVLVDYFALPLLVGLVSCPSDKISHEAICTLGYAAISGPQWRIHVLSSGAFDPVISRLDELLGLEEPLMLQACSWTLANFCKGNVLNTDQTGKALMTLKKLLEEKQDDAVVGIACWAIHDISDGGVQALIDTGIYSLLANLLKRNYGNYTPSVLIPMLVTLRNILEEDDTEFTSFPKIMSDALMSILSRNNDKGLQNSICNIISNLTVISTTFIQCMLDNGTVDHLLKYLDMVAKKNIKAREARIKAMHAHEIRVDELKDDEVNETYEAALAISHLASNTSLDQVRKLVERDCIKRLCYLLSKQTPRQDSRVVASCLDGILNMLNAEEVFKEFFVTNAFSVEDRKSIEDLCGHTIHVISVKATTILTRISNRLC